MKITAKQKRLLRTSADEVGTLKNDEVNELLGLLLKGLVARNKDVVAFNNYPDVAILGYILEFLETLNGDDYFGTEGWQRGLFGVDL
jgi:hypothetical protein